MHGDVKSNVDNQPTASDCDGNGDGVPVISGGNGVPMVMVCRWSVVVMMLCLWSVTVMCL